MKKLLIISTLMATSIACGMERIRAEELNEVGNLYFQRLNHLSWAKDKYVESCKAELNETADKLRRCCIQIIELEYRDTYTMATLVAILKHTPWLFGDIKRAIAEKLRNGYKGRLYIVEFCKSLNYYARYAKANSAEARLAELAHKLWTILTTYEDYNFDESLTLLKAGYLHQLKCETENTPQARL